LITQRITTFNREGEQKCNGGAVHVLENDVFEFDGFTFLESGDAAKVSPGFNPGLVVEI
jgi:hypothetical protein